MFILRIVVPDRYPAFQATLGERPFLFISLKLAANFLQGFITPTGHQALMEGYPRGERGVDFVYTILETSCRWV